MEILVGLHGDTHSFCSAFWDIVLLSSGDQEQKKSYEQQIALKKSRNEIPTFVK